jgi:predicted dehydrogenase
MAINVGVIGYGYWGPNLVRNFFEIGESRVTMVCDLLPDRLAKAKDRYPAIKTTTDPRDLLNEPAVDAVVVSTPVSTHFELTLQALQAGKHVLVEKPMTATSEQAMQLIEEAKRRKLVLMVDHTFVYTGAVRKIHELVRSGELGDIYYFDSVRVNLGLFQHDVNVIWDLAVHDLSIINYVLPLQPTAVSAIGINHIPGEPENIAYLTLLFDERLIAHIHINWLAPVKVRRTLIGGSQKMIVYDDLEPSEKVKVYDKGVTVNPSPENIYQLLISHRSGDMWAPRFDRTEALRMEALHFVNCIKNGERPITDGEVGLQVVRILEAANKSITENGRFIEL